jgi:hypothetical protein
MNHYITSVFVIKNLGYFVITKLKHFCFNFVTEKVEDTYPEELLGSRDDMSNNNGSPKRINNMFIIWM